MSEGCDVPALSSDGVGLRGTGVDGMLHDEPAGWTHEMARITQQVRNHTCAIACERPHLMLVAEYIHENRCLWLC